MSNAKTPVKVLRVALRRIQKGWVQSAWSLRDKKTGVTRVCIEGGVYGYAMNNAKNFPVCKTAIKLIQEAIDDKYPGQFTSIPAFNDNPDTTYQMVEEVVKLAIIKAETGGLLREDENDRWW